MTNPSEGPARSSRDQSLTLARHSSIDLPVSFKLSALQGSTPPHSLLALLANPSLKHAGSQHPSIPSDLYIQISLYANNKLLCARFTTAHKSFKSKDSYVWNETITMPIKYRDLPLESQLAVTVFDIAGPREVGVVGGGTMRLFGKKATLKKGKQRLFLWKGKEADGSADTETPSKVRLEGDLMGPLEKLVKRHERGDVVRLDWLDKLAFRGIEKVHAVSLRCFRYYATVDWREKTELAYMRWVHDRLNRPSQITSSSTSICLALTFLLCSLNSLVLPPLLSFQ